MRTVALIQARMSSSRFPGKVVADLAGRPMIEFMVERVRRAETLDDVVVVTSVDASDDPLAALLAARNIPYFRGDLDDVLNRYVDAAAAFAADMVVRLTGDCPLSDPAIIDAVVKARANAGAHYASNIDPATFADGWDVECFTLPTLLRAGAEACQQAQREHVTLWMRSAVDLQRVNHYGIVDSSQLRLTVDYPDDLDVVRRLVGLMSPKDHVFDQFDVLRCLSANVALIGGNPHERNEGLLKSLSAQAN